MGDAEPDQDVLQYLNAKRSAAACDPKAELCRPENILQGGKPFPDKGPKRDLIKSVLAADADRIRLVMPAKVLQDAQGRPQCRNRE